VSPLYILSYLSHPIYAHLDSPRLDSTPPTLSMYINPQLYGTMPLDRPPTHKRKLLLEISLLVLSSPAVYPTPRARTALHIPKPYLTLLHRHARIYVLFLLVSVSSICVVFPSTNTIDRYNHTLSASSRRFHSIPCYVVAIHGIR